MSLFTALLDEDAVRFSGQQSEVWIAIRVDQLIPKADGTAGSGTQADPYASLCGGHAAAHLMKTSIRNSGWFGFSASQQWPLKMLVDLILLLVNIVVLQGSAAEPQTGTIVSPAPPQGQYGNFGLTLGLGMQQIHANTEFSSLASDVIAITGVAFRWSERTVSTEVVIPYVGILMGTFNKPLSEMSVRASENVGNDYRIVVSALDVRVIAQPPSSPAEFNVKFEFQEPFYYDRRSGHLILGLGVGNPPGNPIFGWDAHGGTEFRGHVHFLHVSVPGAIDYGGLVTEFTFIAVPEPAVLMFWATGLGILVMARKAFL
jgi:hypothetical protein